MPTLSPNPFPIINDHKWASVHYLILNLALLFLLCISTHLSSCSGSDVSFVHTLPGFPGTLPFKLETGYIGVGENEDVQLFYYFIESERNPREDPLLLWISGGPGCSAFSALAIEIGPLRFNIAEYNGSLPTWELNPYAWTKVSSVIFLDAPVGTGFSYSRTLEGFKSGDKTCAGRTYEFLRKWLISHQEFITNPLYLSSGSYGGFLIPHIALEISNGIEAEHKPPMNLKGYLLGNAVTDIKHDLESRIPYAHNMGLISDEFYESIKGSCKGEYWDVDEANSECKSDLQAFTERTRHLNRYNILARECPDIFRVMNIEKQDEGRHVHVQENYVELLLSQPAFPTVGCRNYVDVLSNIWGNDISVRDALGVRKGTINTWSRCNFSVDYVKDMDSRIQHHRNLTARGFRALIYSGVQDMTIPFLGTLSWIRTLNFSIIDDWRPWFDIDGKLGGYSRVYSNNLTFASVQAGGHTAVEDNPKECFAMFKRWISKQPL